MKFYVTILAWKVYFSEKKIVKVIANNSEIFPAKMLINTLKPPLPTLNLLDHSEDIFYTSLH